MLGYIYVEFSLTLMTLTQITKACFFSLCIFIVISLTNCKAPVSKDKQLARQYCGSCHLFPEPNELDKKTWENGVLPQMGLRLGFSGPSPYTQDTFDINLVAKLLPKNPVITSDEWQAIKNFYINNAPDSLEAPEKIKSTTLTQFTALTAGFPHLKPLTTLVKVNELNNKIYFGGINNLIYQLNANLAIEDSIPVKGPPSFIYFEQGKNPITAGMGHLFPTEKASGELAQVNFQMHKILPFIDSLQRPVHLAKNDLNNDGLQDLLVCNYGNFTGSLMAYEYLGELKYRKHIVNNNPGSRKVILQDFNKDGLTDFLLLIAQGDERILMYTNKGNFKFEEKMLLRFPAIYGSSYFELADFNADGFADILYTNGDNADYSFVLKPYHGVRIFMNNGKNEFKEKWFFPMFGASKAMAFDFDNDNDLDIAAIAYFPDFVKNPEESFIYFENKGDNTFTPHTTQQAHIGRWIDMELGDYDNDGDKDIILAALNISPTPVPVQIQNLWEKENKVLLVLNNNLIKK